MRPVRLEAAVALLMRIAGQKQFDAAAQNLLKGANGNQSMYLCFVQQVRGKTNHNYTIAGLTTKGRPFSAP